MRFFPARFSLVFVLVLACACNNSQNQGGSFQSYFQDQGYNDQTSYMDQTAAQQMQQMRQAQQMQQQVRTTPSWQSRVQIQHGAFQQAISGLQQQAAAVGARREHWLFADQFRVFLMQHTMVYGQEDFQMAMYEGGVEIPMQLVLLGRDGQGNSCFKQDIHEGNQASIVLAQDLSWIYFPALNRQFAAATLDQCDEAYACGIARKAYMDEKYRLFTDFFKTINQSFGAGVEEEEDVFVYGDRSGEVVAIAKIRAKNALAIADYVGWSTSFGDVTYNGNDARGNLQFAARMAVGQNVVQGVIEMTPDEQKISVGGRTLRRISPESAWDMVDKVRLAEDSRRSYQEFMNLYNNWTSAYERQLNFVNNTAVKEIYKFSARSSMSDYQMEMRKIRQRAARVGYNLPASPYEGADNLSNQAEINRYQWARDGVNYGNSNTFVEPYPGYYLDGNGNQYNLQDLNKRLNQKY